MKNSYNRVMTLSSALCTRRDCHLEFVKDCHKNKFLVWVSMLLFWAVTCCGLVEERNVSVLGLFSSVLKTESMFLRNAGIHQQVKLALLSRRQTLTTARTSNIFHRLKSKKCPAQIITKCLPWYTVEQFLLNLTGRCNTKQEIVSNLLRVLECVTQFLFAGFWDGDYLGNEGFDLGRWSAGNSNGTYYPFHLWPLVSSTICTV